MASMMSDLGVFWTWSARARPTEPRRPDQAETTRNCQGSGYPIRFSSGLDISRTIALVKGKNSLMC